MITTGPYTPVVGTPITLYDPAKFTTGDVAVQLQNASNLPLACTIGGYTFEVAPWTAATIPTAQAVQLIILPGSGTTTAVGSITLVWLLEGEVSRVPDGPLVGNVALVPGGGSLSATFVIPFQYAVSGTIIVPSGATGYMPPLIMPVLAGTTVQALGVWGLIRAGTSATFNIEQNGTTIPGLGSVVVTTAKTYFPASSPASITDGDEFYSACTAVSGSPDGLSLGLAVKVTS